MHSRQYNTIAKQQPNTKTSGLRPLLRSCRGCKKSPDQLPRKTQARADGNREPQLQDSQGESQAQDDCHSDVALLDHSATECQKS